MRRSLLVLLLVAACHPPSLRDRARDMSAKLGDLGAKVVVAVKPVAPSTDQLQAMATDAATAQLASAVAGQGTISLNQQVHLGGEGTAEPAPQTAEPAARPSTSGSSTSVPMTIHRTQAPADIFAAHMATRGGARSCAVYTSQDECVKTCTDRLKANMMRTDQNALQSCTCMQEAPGHCK
jgi:hypothetical protein